MYILFIPTVWLDDLEYNVYGLPRPNVTIFLDMPPKYGIELMKDRANKSNGVDKKDIHESDISYLQKSIYARQHNYSAYQKCNQFFQDNRSFITA